MPSPADIRTPTRRLLAAMPPALTVALAVGYLGAGLVDGVGEPRAAGLPPLFNAALVGLQAAALLVRSRAAIPVFGVVVVLDAVVLATSEGELGVGALAVMFAAYTLVRERARYWLPVVGIAGVTTAAAGGIAMTAASTSATPAILAVTATRVILQYGVPAAIAEFRRGREQLAQAVLDRTELAERARLERAERDVIDVRTAMARELHDIAAHHLTGIIVGAQAASALAVDDPQRTREMLRTLQQDARTTLADLRRTVGLLRGTDHGHPADDHAPVPTLANLAKLVATAVGHGQSVEFVVDGTPRSLGPLAETAAYRMVQESLANAARHAPGSACTVLITYAARSVRVTVSNNEPTPVNDTRTPHNPPPSTGRGYGLSGMEERAELVGAQLTIDPRPGEGWRNQLDIPTELNGGIR
ncbi:MAG: sensor histidine kinase [Rhodococcus sp. (in: high G+C Gram-positive bacteria)]